MEIAIVLLAAFGAGILNTIAGGGTFLTFPALVLVGVPPVAANATSAAAVFPGYLGFYHELAKFDRRQLLRLVILTLVGGAGRFILTAGFIQQGFFDHSSFFASERDPGFPFRRQDQILGHNEKPHDHIVRSNWLVALHQIGGKTS